MKIFHIIFYDKAKRMYRSSIPNRGNSFVLKHEIFYAKNIIRQHVNNAFEILADVIFKNSHDWEQNVRSWRSGILERKDNSIWCSRSTSSSKWFWSGWVMHNTVAGLEWTQIEIAQCSAADVPWNIQKLFAALDTARLHHEKPLQAKGLFNKPNPVPTISQ